MTSPRTHFLRTRVYSEQEKMQDPWLRQCEMLRKHWIGFLQEALATMRRGAALEAIELKVPDIVKRPFPAGGFLQVAKWLEHDLGIESVVIQKQRKTLLITLRLNKL